MFALGWYASVAMIFLLLIIFAFCGCREGNVPFLLAFFLLLYKLCHFFNRDHSFWDTCITSSTASPIFGFKKKIFLQGLHNEVIGCILKFRQWHLQHQQKSQESPHCAPVFQAGEVRRMLLQKDRLKMQ